MKAPKIILVVLGLMLAVGAAVIFSAPSPALAAYAAVEAVAAPVTQAQQTYVVQYGDTLWSIAQRFGVSVERIAAANGITNPSLIYAGQVLVIPDGNATPVPTATRQPTVAPTATTQPTVAPTVISGEVIEYVVQRNDNLSSIASRFNTTVDAIRYHNNINNPNLIFAGTVLKIVVGDRTSRPDGDPAPDAAATPTPRPSGGTFGGKWIDVDLGDQVLVAYEGDMPVYDSLISSGTSSYPTPLGTFKVYTKLRYDDMRGGSGADYYYIPDVPHVMYFYTGGYAIHGAFWHTNFGTPMSHGCVNLPLDAAEWVYNWAPNGITVNIHW